MIKTIATDLDGTLFYPKRRFRLMQSKNTKFLRKFLDDKTHHVVIVSGRNVTMAKKISKKVKKPISMIGCNGAFIYHEGKIIEESYFTKEEVKQIMSYINKDKSVHITLSFTNLMPIIITTKDFPKFLVSIGHLALKFQMAYHEDFLIGDISFKKYLKKKNCHFYKIMPCFGFGKKGIETAKQKTEQYQRDLGDKYEIIWSNNAIEIMKKEVNKANALKKYLNMLKLNEFETAVVGDSGNDVPMFEAFEQSFCMSNGNDEVKTKAKNIVKGVYELEKYL